LVSVLSSVILAGLHVVGGFASRWPLLRRDMDEAIFPKLAREIRTTEEYHPEKVEDKIHDLRAIEFRKKLLQLVSGIMPGPELCFLALTITVSLFLVFNYSSVEVRKGLCPWFAVHNQAFPVFLGLIIVSIILWLGTSFWREVLLRGAQKKWRKTSMITMLAIGAGTIGAYVYIIMAGR